MKILTYRGLDTSAIPGYDKLAANLGADDFRSADVKKIGDNLYRARLDRSNRLLFALYRHQGERCALVLEYIHQHAYEKSRFLARGVAIDEDRIPEATAEAADDGAGTALSEPDAAPIPSAGQGAVVRRRPGGGVSAAAAAGDHRLRRQRQDRADAGEDEGRERRHPVRHALGLSGAERPRTVLRQRLAATTTRTSISCPFASTWRASMCRTARRSRRGCSPAGPGASGCPRT